MRISSSPAVFGLALLFVAVGAVYAEDPQPAPKAPASTNPRAVIKTNMGEIVVELFQDETPKTVANFLGLANGTKTWRDLQGNEQTRPFYDGLLFHRVAKDFMIQGGCPRGNGTGGPGYKFADEMSATSLGLDKHRLIHNGRPHPWTNMPSTQHPDFQIGIVMPLLKKLGHPTDPKALGKLSKEQMTKLNQDLTKEVVGMTLEDAYTLMGYKYNNSLKSSLPRKGVLAMANSGPDSNGSQFFINLRDTAHLVGKHTVFGKVVQGFDIAEKIGRVKVNHEDRPLEPIKIISIRSLVTKPTTGADK